MAFFDGWNWGAIIQAGAALFSASNARSANSTAANIATTNRDANTALFREAGDKARAAVEPILTEGRAIAQPGISYLRSVTAQNPYSLNPQQSREVADRTLSATRGVPLSLRGSGRTSTAIINDTTNRARDTMVGQNLARGDAAANTLTTQGMSAVRTAAPALANIATGQASNIAAENTTASNQERDSATTTAESDNAALSSIARYFATSQAEAARPGQYERYKREPA